MLPFLDYDHVGLISGLEVHQQLLTDHKLFCRCPAGVYTTEHDGVVLRHMRPTLSELGEYDGTALMEFKTRKQIVYLLNHLNVCTYEMDDTPPFLVNQQAVDGAIELCLMMHMDIIDEVHIARKQYLDGSIPTGFQRTAIIGVNGYLPFQGRKLSVSHVSLEEDSCREVSDKGHKIVFRTDRLGMPLTETVTGPELYTPEQVRDAILLCGLTARSTARVRTGIGAARQDVNVSVRGGNRVEIKGVMKAAYAVKLVHNEGIRQVHLLALRDALAARGLRSPQDIVMRRVDVTDLLGESDKRWRQKVHLQGYRIYAVAIQQVAGLSQHPTQPDLTFTDELEGRVRVIACLDESPILLDSQHFAQNNALMPKRESIAARLQLQPNDDFYIVWGPEQDCITACEEIQLRWQDATLGVPKETRQALMGGRTTFERILPGPDRMYPDTDSPPTLLTRQRVEQLRNRLQPAPWNRYKVYDRWGVPRETTDYLIRRNKAQIVEEVVKRTGVDGLTASIEIGQRAKALKRAGIPIERLTAGHWVQIFDLYTEAQIPREAIRLVAKTLAIEPQMQATEAQRLLGISMQPDAIWQDLAQQVDLSNYRKGRGDTRAKQLRYLCGKAVKLLENKAPAKQVVAYIEKQLGQLEP